MTYNEAHAVILSLGSAFVKLGLKPGSMVGICSVNRAEWVLTEQACNGYGCVLTARVCPLSFFASSVLSRRYSDRTSPYCLRRLVSVPLYDTLGDEAIEHIVHQTELSVIVITSDKAKILTRIKASNLE